jgi:hypothetical protein
VKRSSLSNSRDGRYLGCGEETSSRRREKKSKTA